MPRTGGYLTRRRIVSRAANLFRRKGFRNVGMTEILRVCGISKGTFYFYFPSKQVLGNAVVQRYLEDMPLAIAEAFSSPGWKRGVERLLNYFLGPKSRREPHGAPLVSLGLEFAGSNPFLVASIADVLQTAEQSIADVMAKHGFDPSQARRRASTFMAALHGHVIRLTITSDDRHAANARRHLASLLKSAPQGTRRRGPSAGKPVRNKGFTTDANRKFFVKKHLDIVDDRSIMQHLSLAEAGRARLEGKWSEILEGAAKLFWEKGFYGTPLEELLSYCEVPKGSFYFFFKSKLALASIVLDYYRLRCEAHMDAAFYGGTWKEAVESMSLAALSGVSPPALACPLGNMGLEFAGNDKKLRLKVTLAYQSMEDRFADGLAASGMPRPTARKRAAYAVALFQGHFTRIIIFDDIGLALELRDDLLALAD